MPSVYIASPLGFSDATRGYYVDSILRAVREAGLEVLDPWDAPDAPSELDAARLLPVGEARQQAFRRVNARLGARNAELIEACDALLAVLEGLDVDSGTAAEVGYAAGLGKPIAGLRLDRRAAGENEVGVVNLQVEYFIQVSGGRIHRELAPAIVALADLAAQ